jgi:hypothetical protein
MNGDGWINAENGKALDGSFDNSVYALFNYNPHNAHMLWQWIG